MTKGFLLSLLLCCWPAYGHGQGNLISGCIIDAQTKQPVPFVSVGIRADGEGALSKESGCFRFRGLKGTDHDSLICLGTGYDYYAVLLRRGSTKNLRIQLTKHVPTPAEIAQTTKNQQWMEQTVLGLPGTQYAFWLKSDQPQPGKLRAVWFFMGKNGFPKEEFRLRIYHSGGPLGAPGEDLLTEAVWCNPTGTVAESGWCRLDLTPYAIVPPLGGYFVALEFEHNEHSSFPEHLKNYAPTGPTMSPPVEVQNQHMWLYFPISGWKELASTKAALSQFNPLIKVETE